jgi:hypothetical protein
MICIQHVAPSTAAVTTVRLTLGRRPSTAKGGAHGDLSSESKQFNSNVNGLAPWPRPPFRLEFPAAATLRPTPVEFSAGANQAIWRVDEFNRRSDRL